MKQPDLNTAWTRAVRAAGLTHTRLQTHDPWTGRPHKITSAPRLGPPRTVNSNIVAAPITAAEGTTLDDLTPHTRTLAAALHLHAIHIEQTTPNTGVAYLIWRDPWPKLRHWQPPDNRRTDRIEFATDQLGRRVSIPTMNVSFLIGASKGGGKSVLEFVLAAGAACREHVAICAVDPKGVELQFWDRRFTTIATTPTETVALLAALNDEMGRRYAALRASRRKQFDRPTAETPAIWLIIDEGRDVCDTKLEGPWKPTARQCLAAISRLAFLGRAAGISVIFATQHPAADIIPTTLRSNLLNRWMGIGEGPNQAQTVLGVDDAYTVDVKRLRPGTGWFQREGQPGLPLVQVDWLDERRADKVDEATAHLRPDVPALDALRAAGTYNPAPPLEPLEPSRSGDLEALEAACLVADLAGISAAEIHDLGSLAAAVVPAAAAVGDDDELAGQLTAAVELLTSRFRK